MVTNSEREEKREKARLQTRVDVREVCDLKVLSHESGSHHVLTMFSLHSHYVLLNRLRMGWPPANFE